MKYSLFYHEEHDMETWISPEQFGVHFFPETIEDGNKIKEINEWSMSDEIIFSDIRIWACKELIYFDSIEDRTMFLFRWL